MKKFFLLILTMMVCIATHALNVGDFCYTVKGRFKVVGENLVTNGNFANGLDSWTGIDGNPADATQWSIEPSAGPKGENALMSFDPMDNHIMTKVQTSGSKMYVVSFDAKAAEPLTTTTTPGGARYLGIYANNTGEVGATSEGYRLIGSVKNITTEWQTFTDTVYSVNAEYVMFVMQNMSVETYFTNISINEIIEVADDREITILADYARSLLNNPDFPNMHEEFQELIEELESMKSEEDIYIVKEYVEAFEGVINSFLEANSANATNYLKNYNFTGISATSMVKTETGKIGSWITAGSRWQYQVPDAFINDNQIRRQVPGKSSVKDGSISQKIDVPAGKYMFTMKVLGHYYTASKNSAVIDESKVFTGAKVFINNDSCVCEPLSLYNPRRFYVIANIAEGDSANVGMFIPAFEGAEVKMALTDLRWIGGTEEALAEYMLGKELAEAKLSLKNTITEAQALHDSEDYLFEKQALADSIAASQVVYNTSMIIDTLANQTKRLTRAMSAYKKINLEYTTLNTTIDKADEVIADTKYTVDKTALITLNSECKEYVDSINETLVRDSLKLTTYNTRLQTEIDNVTSSILSSDEMYSFYKWSGLKDATYTSVLADTAITTSSNATLYIEQATFAGNSLNNRLAFKTEATRDLSVGNGLKVYYSGKNTTVMSILNLKEGDKVTVDWKMGNSSHHHYIVSMDAKYTKADGTEVVLTKSGKDASSMIDNNTNTEGVNGLTRSVYTMTKDGSLDFYLGNSGASMIFSYIAIDYNKGGLKGDANNDGVVDVADITAIASHILGTTPEVWNADNADANNDGVIDVADITATASIILGSN